MLIELKDKSKIENFLKQDPYLHLYSIGDLDDFFFPYCDWYGWKKEEHLSSLFMLYKGQEELPTLLALEEQDPDEAKELLLEIVDQLPKYFYAHLSPFLSEILEERFPCEYHGRYIKMQLTRERFHPAITERFLSRSLTTMDTSLIMDLYKNAYPEHWFDPRMLQTGQYMGVFDNNKLIAIAGVHVYSPEYRVAALGNICVHPAYRGRGVGRLVTSRLCEKLFNDVDHIGLNVNTKNGEAIALYQRLGFKIHAEYDEIMVGRSLH